MLFNSICIAKNNLPHLFLFLGGDKPTLYKSELENSCVTGAQIIYSWKQLEPKKDIYDFSLFYNQSEAAWGKDFKKNESH